MDSEDHKPARPNFLRRGPGLLDMLSQAWHKASEGFRQLHSIFNHLNTPEKLPSYVAFVGQDIICVQIDQKNKLIKPFCDCHQLDHSKLFVTVPPKEYIGLRRDILEEYLEQAKHLGIERKGNVAPSRYARELIQAFAFLKHPNFQSDVFQEPIKPRVHYRVDPVWIHSHR